MGRLPGGPQLLYFRDDVFFPPGPGSKSLVDLVLKDRPECDELLLGEFPPPGGEETKPYHLNDLCRSLQAQVVPRDAVLLANSRNNQVPDPTLEIGHVQRFAEFGR